MSLVYPTYPRYTSNFHFFKIGLQISKYNDVIGGITDFPSLFYLGT